MNIATILQRAGETVDCLIRPIAEVDLINFNREVEEASLEEAKINLIQKVNIVFEKLSDKFPELEYELNIIQNKIKLFNRKINLGLINSNTKIHYSLDQNASSETTISVFLEKIIYEIERNQLHIFKYINKLLDGDFDIKNN